MPQEKPLSTITGVYVDGIKLETMPYDDPGIIQEYVGFGATHEYMLQPAQSITEGKIQEFMDTWSDKIQPPNEYRLKYTLLVRSRHPRGARAKARAYVRAANPFEPSVIDVRNVSETTRHQDVVSDAGPLSEFHDVSVVVSK